jgi:transcriptional regulator with XRE-family HTH domain
MGSLPLRTIVAKNIRERRLRLGLSQELLAEKSALHRTYIGAVERGERNITLLSLGKIAAALKVSPAQLAGPTPNTLMKAKYVQSISGAAV